MYFYRFAANKVAQSAGERLSPPIRKMAHGVPRFNIIYGRSGTVQGSAMGTESAPGYNIFLALQTPVRVIEPTPNWSTVGLRGYKTVGRDCNSGADNHKQGPNRESTLPPPLIFHFNH